MPLTQKAPGSHNHWLFRIQWQVLGKWRAGHGWGSDPSPLNPIPPSSHQLSEVTLFLPSLFATEMFSVIITPICRG